MRSHVEKELIVNTARELFFKLLEGEATAKGLKIDFREAKFLETLETAFNSVLQMVSKAVKTIND